MRRPSGTSAPVIALAVVLTGLAVGSVFALVPFHSTSTGSYGAVEGVVSVGPSMPVCPARGSCDVNMSGYSLTFTANCPGLCPALSRAVPLAADGSYSTVLPTGTYTVSMDPCGWLGCSRVLPRTVSVAAGETAVLNVTIDTGIR